MGVLYCNSLSKLLFVALRLVSLPGLLVSSFASDALNIPPVGLGSASSRAVYPANFYELFKAELWGSS